MNIVIILVFSFIAILMVYFAIRIAYVLWNPSKVQRKLAETVLPEIQKRKPAKTERLELPLNDLEKEEPEEEKGQETWTCPICEEENPSKEDICQGCGSLREESCYDAIADEEDEL